MRPPRPGAALCSFLYSPMERAASGLTSGLGVAITKQSRDRRSTFPIRGSLRRSCPLPSGASSIHLEDSEHLMQPDHDTSCESVALVFVCSVPEHPCSTPRGVSVKGPRPQRWHGKKLVAGERLPVAAPHQRADRGGYRAYVGPPALVGVGAGGERGLRQERDRAAQVRKPDDLGHEAVVLLGLVV